MKLTKTTSTYAMLGGTIGVTIFAYEATQPAYAAPPNKDMPSIAESKASAEEGFIYGLPIVMN